MEGVQAAVRSGVAQRLWLRLVSTSRGRVGGAGAGPDRSCCGCGCRRRVLVLMALTFAAHHLHALHACCPRMCPFCPTASQAATDSHTPPDSPALHAARAAILTASQRSRGSPGAGTTCMSSTPGECGGWMQAGEQGAAEARAPVCSIGDACVIAAGTARPGWLAAAHHLQCAAPPAGPTWSACRASTRCTPRWSR